jgi:hypothetical protein
MASLRLAQMIFAIREFPWNNLSYKTLATSDQNWLITRKNSDEH